MVRIQKNNPLGVSLKHVSWDNGYIPTLPVPEIRPRKRASTITKRVKIAGLSLATVFALAIPANADQRYVVNGNDQYRIGQADIQTSISYTGTQTLSVRRDGRQTRFTAQAHYTRADASGKVPAQATFVQIMTPQGELKDSADLDPDYLTVLNQPFAIELDRPTLQDLLHLRGRVPFSFPAPMTGGLLQGYLERGSVARVSTRPTLAVNFDATGPMTGPLPDHAGMTIAGKMRMRGTAFYALRGDPLLLALNETLTISGTLHSQGQDSPVTITYSRSIKADDSGPAQTEADGNE